MDLFGDTDLIAVCEHFEPIDAATAADPGQLRASIENLSRRMKADAMMVGGIASISDDVTVSDLVTACQGLSIAVPATITDSGLTAQSHPLDQAWLIKRFRSGGGLGVHLWDRSNASLVESFESNECYLQQRIGGRTFGVVAISNGRQTRVLGVSRSLHQRIDKLPFVYAGSIGPWAEPNFPSDAIQQLAHRIAQSHRLRGLFNLDLIQDQANRWWLLEVNCRPSGSCEVIERAAIHCGSLSEHQSLMGMHCDAIAGRCIQWNDARSTSIHCKRIVYANRDGRFQSDQAPPGIADIPKSGAFVPTGQPIATLLIDSFMPNDSFAQRIRAGVRKVQAACW